MNNPTLIPDFIKHEIYDKVLWLARYHEVKLEFANIERHMVDIQVALTNKPIAYMSRLERSMASSRSLALSKDSTKAVNEFLTSVMRSLSKAVNVEQLGHMVRISHPKLHKLY